MAVKRTAGGQFAKGGGSPNPAGRPRGQIADLAREARSHSRLAIETIVHICKTGDNRERLTAAQALLDRGFGRPSQTIDTNVVVKGLASMTDIELAALESRLCATQAEADEETSERLN